MANEFVRKIVFEYGYEISFFEESEKEEAIRTFEYFWDRMTKRERKNIEYYSLYLIEAKSQEEIDETPLMDLCVEMILDYKSNADINLLVLMQDHCTRPEAEKHLKEGTTVYKETDKDDYIANCVGGLMDEEEAVEAWEALPCVIYENEKYKIDYAL